MQRTTELTVDRVVEVMRAAIVGLRGQDVDLAPDTRLDGLGLDSLEIAEIFVALDDEAGTDLDRESAGAIVVVADLARLRPL